MTKILTSFTHLITGEGHRLSYTYSEVDENGNLVSQNNRGNFIVVQEELINSIKTIEEYIKENKLS